MMMNQTSHSNPVSTQHKVDSLKALLLSLILGALGIILLLSIFSTGAVVSASQGENTLNNSTHQTSDSTTAPTTSTVHITKTVEPPHPDTGGVVSICFTIGPRRLDVVLAQDVSKSMKESAGEDTTQTRLEASQEAASAFVNFLPSTDRIAVVTFSTTAYLAQPLTTTKSAITRTIYGLTTTGGTNISEGISVSHKELSTSPRYVSDTIQTIILLSDGIANRPVDTDTAKAYARERAEAAAGDDIKIYTIGFGSDADEDLLQNIADISGGKYFFAPDGDVLETIYLTIALELRNLAITDILAPGVETDCSQWPDNWCVEGPGGVTTLTFPISDSLLLSDPAVFCFTATVNLDPNYEGPINLPGSGICYQDSNGQTICEEFDNPTVTVGGRKIMGYVFYDVNANSHRDAGEAGAGDVIVRTSTGVTTTTSVSGSYVLRTSSEPAISVTTEGLPGYVKTIPLSEKIPAASGTYTADFGIRAAVYLPVAIRNHPIPIIINGGFEDGWTGWSHGGELSQTIKSTNPYSGSFSALLGDPAYRCEDGVPVGSAWMEQIFFVPHTYSPRLSFRYNIFTQDKNPYLSDEFDSFDVKINGVLRFRDAKITGAYGCDPQVEIDLGWRSGKIDLRSYRGQQITFRFENRSHPDGWFNTWTFVDDVQFLP